MLVVVAWLLAATWAGSAFLSESQLKATFLYHFSNFVTWPPETTGRDRPFRYCVGQRGEVENYLEELIRGESLNGRPLRFHLLTDPKEVDNCDILFLRTPLGNHASTLLKRIGNRPVLTVGDSRAFLRQGGMIALIRRQRQVAITIALDEVERHGLKISSLLLDLAEIVDQGDGDQ